MQLSIVPNNADLTMVGYKLMKPSTPFLPVTGAEKSLKDGPIVTADFVLGGALPNLELDNLNQISENLKAFLHSLVNIVVKNTKGIRYILRMDVIAVSVLSIVAPTINPRIGEVKIIHIGKVAPLMPMDMGLIGVDKIDALKSVTSTLVKTAVINPVAIKSLTFITSYPLENLMATGKPQTNYQT